MNHKWGFHCVKYVVGWLRPCIFFRYVAFDPLGHKLITGISNAPHNHTQWDRVAAPPRPGSSLASTSHDSHPHSVVVPPEQDRRITVCYRSLVEQYEQLVQRYYDLSRARTPTVSVQNEVHENLGCNCSGFHLRLVDRFFCSIPNYSSRDICSAFDGTFPVFQWELISNMCF